MGDCRRSSNDAALMESTASMEGNDRLAKIVGAKAFANTTEDGRCAKSVEHARIPSLCKECSGGSFCEHGAQRSKSTKCYGLLFRRLAPKMRGGAKKQKSREE